MTAEQLLDVTSTPGDVTEAGLRNNISVGIQYLDAWLRGTGAVGIFNLMEDAATAEISRSQVWQWLHNDVDLDDRRHRDAASWSSGSSRRRSPSSRGGPRATTGTTPGRPFLEAPWRTTSPSSSPSRPTSGCPERMDALALAERLAPPSSGDDAVITDHRGCAPTSATGWRTTR